MKANESQLIIEILQADVQRTKNALHAAKLDSRRTSVGISGRPPESAAAEIGNAELVEKAAMKAYAAAVKRLTDFVLWGAIAVNLRTGQDKKSGAVEPSNVRGEGVNLPNSPDKARQACTSANVGRDHESALRSESPASPSR